MNDLVSKCSTRAVLETKGGCEFWKKFPQILFYSGLNFSNTKKKKKKIRALRNHKLAHAYSLVFLPLLPALMNISVSETEIWMDPGKKRNKGKLEGAQKRLWALNNGLGSSTLSSASSAL